MQEEKHVELLKAGKQAKHRLEELAPEIRLKGKGNYWISSLSVALSSLFSECMSQTLLKVSWIGKFIDAFYLNHQKKKKNI